jgi:hypothetical protein
MKKHITSCLIILLSTHNGFAAGERNPAGSRALAMGGTSVAVSDIWSLFNNQAGTAWFNGACAAICAENNYLIGELTREHAGFILPVKVGVIGLQGSRFGNENYNELKAGLNFARKFGRHFSIGVQLDYLLLQLENFYGNRNLVSCEIGLMYRSGKNLSIGMQIVNPVPVKVTTHPSELLPSLICTGISCRFSDNFSMAVEAEKDIVNPIRFRVGGEYQVVRPVCFRIGISTDPICFSFGLGFDYRKFRFDISTGYHQALGFSPSGSLIYSFL